MLLRTIPLFVLIAVLPGVPGQSAQSDSVLVGSEDSPRNRSASGAAPRLNPISAPRQNPDFAPHQNPEFAPNQNPVSAPRRSPDSEPRENPDSEPRGNRVSAPRRNPVSPPRTVPDGSAAQAPREFPRAAPRAAIPAEEGCDHFSAVLVLRCVSPLIEYTKQYTPTGPTANPSLICNLYDEYKDCAPGIVRKACSRFVASVESVYEYVCSPEVKANFTRQYSCLAKQERNPKVITCESNVTATLRDASISANLTAEMRQEEQCGAIREYFKCVKKQFKDNCGLAGWDMKKEITVRSTTASIANCTNLEEMDMSEPICHPNGTCTCHEGYMMNKTGKCEDIDECMDAFGLCSQRCVNTKGGYRCHCDDRYYSLDDDERTCLRLDADSRKEEEKVTIMFAHGQSIWEVSEDGEDFKLIRPALKKAAMIDILVKEKRLYYVDIGANLISNMLYRASFPNVMQNYDVDGTEGIAVDWIGLKFYYLRLTNIYVEDLDGRHRRTLFRNVFKLPRALAVYPQEGYLYASDWGQEAFIAKAAMDGSTFARIVTTRLVWPNGLAVDYYARRLYWADAFLDVIECSDLDGSHRRTVISDASNVPHVFSMVVFDDLLYWTDWTFRGIVTANKHSGENVTVIANAALLPYGIKVSHPAAQPDLEMPNPCEALNCSHICVLSPVIDTTSRTLIKPNTILSDEMVKTAPSTFKIDGKCVCSDGFRLGTDGRTCIAECDDAKEIECGGTDPKCLSRRYMCDDIDHCAGFEDELGCPKRVCLQGEFQCDDGQGCVLANQVCDRVVHCKDRSDELYC